LITDNSILYLYIFVKLICSFFENLILMKAKFDSIHTMCSFNSVAIMTNIINKKVIAVIFIFNSFNKAKQDENPPNSCHIIFG
jgi:hypothetical protein